MLVRHNGSFHRRLARWIKWRPCDDVGEAKEGLENELWRRWSNGRVGEWAVTIGKATEGLENELWRRWSDGKVGQWVELINIVIAELILQPFSRFTYVTAHSSTLPLLHLRHSSFSNSSIASPTSQVLHLIHLASRPWYRYVTRVLPAFAKECVLWQVFGFNLTAPHIIISVGEAGDHNVLLCYLSDHHLGQNVIGNDWLSRAQISTGKMSPEGRAGGGTTAMDISANIGLVQQDSFHIIHSPH